MQRFSPSDQALKALLSAQTALLTNSKTAQDEPGLVRFFNGAAQSFAAITKADLVFVFKTAYGATTSISGEPIPLIDTDDFGVTNASRLPAHAYKTGRSLAEIFLTRGEHRLSLSDIARLRGQGLADEASALLDEGEPLGAAALIRAIPCCAGDADRMAGLALLVFSNPDRHAEDDTDKGLSIAASIVGETIQTHRRLSASQKHRQQTDREPSAVREWRTQASAAIDAFWEADERGRITTLIPLSDRFKSLDRTKWLTLDLKNLEAAHDASAPPPLASLLSDERAFRDTTVKLPQTMGRHKISFSGAPLLPEHRDGVAWFGGCLSVITDDHSSEKERKALMELVGRLERARDRERHLREESETLLQGLRLLSQPLPSRQIFDGLFGLLQGTLGFEGAALVHQNWQGQLVASMASASALEDIDWQQAAAAAGDGLPQQPTLLAAENPLLQTLSAATAETHIWQSGLLVFIELENQPAWLICLHSQHAFFDMAALGLAGRLALLTSQALAHEAERNKAVQSAKLATLGEMATGIAHEMTQPLAAISLAAQNLELVLEDDPIDIDYANGKVETIQSQTERASKIVNQMRVFARQSYDQTGSFAPSKQIDAALGIMGEQLRSHGIALELSYLDNEPVVTGDALQFEQVVLNLFSNARDAIDACRKSKSELDPPAFFDGKIQVVQTLDDAGYMKIRFADNGGGIPDNIMPQLFDPFFTTKPVGQGTGLGLSISYGIMREMGGAIEASNGPDGAQIDLILKVVPPN